MGKSVDNSGAFDALLIDLSKRSLVLIYNYLSNLKQRVKINHSYSSWSEILFGVPQGSILGLLLFNIFM